MRHSRLSLIVALALAAICLVLLFRDWTPHPDSVARGRLAAEKHCGGCHEIDPNAPARMTSGVPNFTLIAKGDSASLLALQRLLAKPHAMPDLHLDPDEITDLAAYFDQLRGT